ncbi:nucleoside triphosphate pyrophosphohydrolase [Hirschia litorea]|uniref:Nucleoside triphosphate pyrophosphohydrolase n=1 Tax=Hirschia litorea TaxID=1199156 RepID=A0ABW2II99_9PROT
MSNSTDRSFVATDNAIADLVRLMQRLRDKETGCPWDVEQTFESILPYTLEEAYEVAEAIERKDMEELKSELGDLFLQVVFHSQIAEDAGIFTIHDVARAIVDKMVNRHPHVFGSIDIESAEAQTTHWEALKAKEREAAQTDNTPVSALDGVASALPALTRSEKLLKRAARTGFDWPSTEDILEKLHEELSELEEASKSGDKTHIEEEMGDVLLVVANLARKHGVDPEAALRGANSKFKKRFVEMELAARNDGNVFKELDLDAQKALWQRAKQAD